MRTNLKSFISTKKTFDKRRAVATLNPTRENCYRVAQASFALSLAKVRLLRTTDKYGYLLMKANADIMESKRTLMTYINYDSNVIQTSLDLF